MNMIMTLMVLIVLVSMALSVTALVYGAKTRAEVKALRDKVGGMVLIDRLRADVKEIKNQIGYEYEIEIGIYGIMNKSLCPGKISINEKISCLLDHLGLKIIEVKNHLKVVENDENGDKK